MDLASELARAYAGRRVLVTGHTGFKGAWLALWLHELGADVTGYALAPVTEPNLPTLIGLDARIRSVIADVRDRAALGGVFADTRPELVLHLAAQARVDVSYRHPGETFEVNVGGTAVVLDTALTSDECRAALVVTSDKCYDTQNWSRGYRETDRLGGDDPYSASKGCQEILVASYRRSFFAPRGLGLATGRAGNVIGGGDFTPGRLVPDCLRAFAREQDVRLRYPDAIRPWQHVLEPLAGYLILGTKLLEDPAEWSQPFNFAPDEADAIPVRDVVTRCSAAWGAKGHWEREPGLHPPETAVLRLDATKAHERLGWQPRWPLDEALGQTIAWHKSFLAGNDMAKVTLAQIRAYGTPRA